MAKSIIVKANEKVAEKVVGTYKKVESAVVDGYKKVEDTVVSGYTKMEDKFVDQYLTKDGETVEEAKARLKKEIKTTHLTGGFDFEGIYDGKLHGFLVLFFLSKNKKRMWFYLPIQGIMA